MPWQLTGQGFAIRFGKQAFGKIGDGGIYDDVVCLCGILFWISAFGILIGDTHCLLAFVIDAGDQLFKLYFSTIFGDDIHQGIGKFLRAFLDIIRPTAIVAVLGR